MINIQIPMSLHSYQYFFNVILKKTKPINSILKTLNWQIKRALPHAQGCCLMASSVFNGVGSSPALADSGFWWQLHYSRINNRNVLPVEVVRLNAEIAKRLFNHNVARQRSCQISAILLHLSPERYYLVSGSATIYGWAKESLLLKKKTSYSYRTTTMTIMANYLGMFGCFINFLNLS